MHARTILAVAVLLSAPMAGCIVPENMTALREELGYASVEPVELAATARASTLTPRVAEEVTLTAEIEGAPLANASITWRVGDDTFSGRSLELDFEAPGTVPVNLTVEADGAVAHDAITLTVQENHPPTAVITVPARDTLVAGKTATLSGTSSTDPDGDTLEHAWEIDGEPIGAGATVEHAFTPGLHEIKLTVSDGLETVVAFDTVAAAERFDAAGNLSLTEDVLTHGLEVGTGVAELAVTLTHTTRLGVDDVDLVLLDADGEPVAAASTSPAPGASTASERLTVPGGDLDAGAYTLETRLERGASSTVTLEGTIAYQAADG